MPKILVCDDNPAVLSAVMRSLREKGYAVTSTNSGEDAICLLGGRPPPDLLILDIAMPGLDGIAVLHSLGPAAPPVVVITGSFVDETEFCTGRVARVLRKPFDQDALLNVVAEVFAARPPVNTDSA